MSELQILPSKPHNKWQEEKACCPVKTPCPRSVVTLAQDLSYLAPRLNAAPSLGRLPPSTIPTLLNGRQYVGLKTNCGKLWDPSPAPLRTNAHASKGPRGFHTLCLTFHCKNSLSWRRLPLQQAPLISPPHPSLQRSKGTGAGGSQQEGDREQPRPAWDCLTDSWGRQHAGNWWRAVPLSFCLPARERGRERALCPCSLPPPPSPPTKPHRQQEQD